MMTIILVENDTDYTESLLFLFRDEAIEFNTYEEVKDALKFSGQVDYIICDCTPLSTIDKYNSFRGFTQLIDKHPGAELLLYSAAVNYNGYKYKKEFKDIIDRDYNILNLQDLPEWIENKLKLYKG